MTDPQNVDEQEGWGWPLLSRKAHYFTKDCRSLCLRWLYSGKRTKYQGVSEKPGPDDCTTCFRKAAKRLAK